jgi:hypothetical protein
MTPEEHQLASNRDFVIEIVVRLDGAVAAAGARLRRAL